MLAAKQNGRAGKSEATLLLALGLAGCGTRSALDGTSAATATRVATPGGGACHDWTEVRYWQVYQSQRTVHGGAFDGRYLYFYGVSAVLRFDTQGAFDDPGAWATADVSSLLHGWGDGYGLDGAVFDGRYIYFVPHGPTAVRYDTTAEFGDSQAWETMSLGDLPSPVYGGFGGGVFDGRYIYFFPAFPVDNASPPARNQPRPVRFDTTGAFSNPGSWQSTSPSPLIVDGWWTYGGGGVFDGRYVYYVANKVYQWHPPNPPPPQTMRYDTTRDFEDPGAWAAAPSDSFGVEVVPVSLSNGLAAAFDGRYVYVIAGEDEQLAVYPARIDPKADFTMVQQWTAGPGVPTWPWDGGSRAPDDTGGIYDYYFPGTAFDGCALYLVCSNGPSWRFDVHNFTGGAPPFLGKDKRPGIEGFDPRQLIAPSGGRFHSPVFDGRYLYIPNRDGHILRFDAHDPPSALPPWSSGPGFDAFNVVR
jgi:hypothetical protein